ncbi:acyltransferase family protein [Paraburkholderia elongata]|uniref:Acyltransferase family protein n=1 Tax=Paraburkholderia elongata TaxID=2675747 RepID=A0A972P0I2_9BURK|nr:acyltransferase [Paraburkholderia elongata]NPT62596.1 acyltransferase family protein [Paraburkholderia elongata]
MNPSKNLATESHWAVLAALRFFLAVVVVAGHFSLYVRLDTLHIFGAGYLNPLGAVYGFFILSGYSIAASIERSTVGFIRRRFVRIWPLYLAAIAFGMVACLLIPNGFEWPLKTAFTPGSASALSVIASLLMLQTVIAGPIPIVGQIWSLSAEWWHYMISPRLRKAPSWVLLVLIAASFVSYINAFPPGPGVAGMGDLSYGKGIIGLSWIWLTGFVYYRHRGTPFALILLIAPSLFAMTINHSTGIPIFITAFVLIAANEFSISERVQKALIFLGDWSYSLYLFHIAGFIVMLHFGSSRSIITLGGAFAVSLAALLLVDYPCRRLFRRKAAPTTVEQHTPVEQNSYDQTTA